MTTACRGQLRAWLPFRSQVFADDMRAMFGNMEHKPGEKKSIKMQYEIHDAEGTSLRVEDSVEISVAVYDRSKYKWLFMDFKLLSDYWTGGIYKTAPDTCVLVLFEQGPRPFGLPYPRRRASDADACSKDLDVMREKGWQFPKTVTMYLMVDKMLEQKGHKMTLTLKDNKLLVPNLQKLSTQWDLRDLYDCGYSVWSDDTVVKMASTIPPPLYPDPDELAGPLYMDVNNSHVPHTLPMTGLVPAAASPPGAHRFDLPVPSYPQPLDLVGIGLAPPAKFLPSPGPAAGQPAADAMGGGRTSSPAQIHAPVHAGSPAGGQANQSVPAKEHPPSASPALSGGHSQASQPAAGEEAQQAAAPASQNGNASKPKQSQQQQPAAPAPPPASEALEPIKTALGQRRRRIKGYGDYNNTKRPGGDFNDQPCFACRSRHSDADNELYLCDNECGWGAHQQCLELDEPLSEGLWFCCKGCEAEFVTRRKEEEQGGQQLAPDEAGKKAGAPAPAADAPPPKRGRGRPPKNKHVEQDGDAAAVHATRTPGPGTVAGGKRGRGGGRGSASAPPKAGSYAAADEDTEMVAADEPADAVADAVAGAGEPPAKKKRGRPRKHPLPDAPASGGAAGEEPASSSGLTHEPKQSKPESAAQRPGSRLSTGKQAGSQLSKEDKAAAKATAAVVEPSVTDAHSARVPAAAQAPVPTDPPPAPAPASKDAHMSTQPLAPSAPTTAPLPAQPAHAAGSDGLDASQISLPDPVFTNEDKVTEASRLAIMRALGRVLRYLGVPQMAPTLSVRFRQADAEESKLQVTYYYVELQECWENRDWEGVKQVFREQYKLPL